MKPAVRKQPPDFQFFILTLILVLIGIVLVYDASFARAGDHSMGDPQYFVKKQAIFAAFGFLVLMLTMRIHPEKFRKITKIMLLFALCLLGLVMVPGIGKSINGAARWIPIGQFHLQPSEFAKMAVVMFLADRLAAKGLRVRDFLSLLPYLLAVGLIAGLVLAEPDMGTAISLIFTTAAMFFVSGARKRHLAAVALFGVMMLSLLVAIEPYRLQRVTTFLHPGKDYYGSGYQITHSLIAHATGGLTGLGLGEGREKFFIPAPETDMVITTLAEEGGFIGMMALLSIFMAFTYKGLNIGHKTKSSYMGLLAIGVTSLIGLQAIINIAVVTASIPATGVPLPFISYGGSYLIVMLFGAGMVLSVSRHMNEQMEEPELKEYENRCNRRRDRRAYLPCSEYSTRTRKVRRRATVRR